MPMIQNFLWVIVECEAHCTRNAIFKKREIIKLGLIGKTYRQCSRLYKLVNTRHPLMDSVRLIEHVI